MYKIMCTMEKARESRREGKQKEGMNEKTSMNGALLQRIIIKNEKMSVFLLKGNSSFSNHLMNFNSFFHVSHQPPERTRTHLFLELLMRDCSEFIKKNYTCGTEKLRAF